MGDDIALVRVVVSYRGELVFVHVNQLVINYLVEF